MPFHIVTRLPAEHQTIQIQAEALRHERASVPDFRQRIFVMLPDDHDAPSDDAPPSQEGISQQTSAWRQADLKRAIAAAEESGVQSYRIEIASDGMISIIVGSQP